MILITLFDLLNPGDVIHIGVLRENLVKRFKSNVYKVIEENLVLISAPIEQGRLFSLHGGENVVIEFNKENTGLYTFYSNVVSIKKTGSLTAVIVKKSSSVKKTQRRDYFRLSYFEDFNVAKCDINEEPREKYKIDKNGIIIEEYEDDRIHYNLSGRDLSGGGFRAFTDETFELGEYLEGSFYIGRREILFRAKVVRFQKIDDPIYKNEVACEFYEMDDRVRAEIISYIFVKERKLRSEEMIK